MLYPCTLQYRALVICHNLGSIDTSYVEPCCVGHILDIHIGTTFLFSMYLLEFVVCQCVVSYRAHVGLPVLCNISHNDTEKALSQASGGSSKKKIYSKRFEILPNIAGLVYGWYEHKMSRGQRRTCK